MNSQRFKRGQIWWYQSSGSISDKENIINSKTRPMLIVSNDIQNRCSNYVIAIPLTTADKKDYPMHTKFTINGKMSTFLAESIQSCNKDYFSYYIETVDDELMKAIEENIKIALGLNLISNDIKLKNIDTSLTVTDIVEKPKKQSGRKGISLEEKQRFINDYENHDTQYMLKKYNIKDKKNLSQKVYMYRKAIKESSK